VRRLIAVLCAVLALGPRGAWAQSAEDKAAAQALFDEARRLLKGGKVAEACEKLKTSHGLDPAAGTLLNLGDCYERLGKTASAWATFKEAVSFARRVSDDRKVKEAQRRAGALEKKLARVSIEVPAGSRVEGLAVTLDKKPVAEATWGTPLPVDPGAHEVGAVAPGHERWSSTIDARASFTARVEVPTPTPKATASATPTATEPEPREVPPAVEPTPTPYEDDSSPGSGLRLAGIVTAAAGVALVGGGVYFGLQAKAKSDEIEGLDTNEPSPDPWDNGLKEEGEAAQTRMVIFTAAGAGAITAGAILYWLGHRAGEQAEIALTPGGAIVRVEARF
jgi:hypothetical protein